MLMSFRYCKAMKYVVKAIKVIPLITRWPCMASRGRSNNSTKRGDQSFTSKRKGFPQSGQGKSSQHQFQQKQANAQQNHQNQSSVPLFLRIDFIQGFSCE